MAIGPAGLAAIHRRLEAGDVSGALQAIEEVLAAEPANGLAWHLGGVVRRRAGDVRGAVAAFQEAVALGHESAELHNSLGLALQALGRRDEAASAFARSLACDPGYLPGLVNRARLMAERGWFEEAVQVLRRADEEYPGSALVGNALAATLAEAGYPAEAASQYYAVLGRESGNLVAAIRLGMVLREQGKADEALGHFQRLAGRFAASPEFADAMAGAMIECGNVTEAERLLEQTSASAPGYFPAHRALARLAREYATGKDPYRSYRALVAQWPAERAIWLDWIGLMLSHRDHAAALPVVADARNHLGADPELDFFEAVARSEEGMNDLAEQLFARAASALGSQNTFRTAWTRHALRRGEPEQAELLATAATDQDPTDQFAWAYLGLAWRLLGDPREFWLHDYEQHVEQRQVDYLADPAALEEVCETLRRLHRAAHHPADQSLRGGTQTEGALFQRADPVIQRLRDAIREQVEAFVAGLPTDPAHPHLRRRASGVKFTGSWSVRLTGQGFHVAHVHQAGWISSALHLVVPPAAVGDAEHAGKLVLGEPPVELGLALPPRRIVQPVEGALVLFPSSMWHGTVPFSGGRERMTVAFDAVPLG